MNIHPSQAQKDMVDLLLTERVPAAEHANWRRHLVVSWSEFDRGVHALRQRNVLPEHARPTEEGLYLDPETLEMFRLTRPKGRSWDLIVSVYSKTAKLRLTQDLEVVDPGTWKKLNAWQSRQKVDKLRAAWKMTDEQKVQYQTGICNFCWKGLKDARSVWHNYGPKCAKKHSLPWGDLPPQAS